MKVGIVQGNIAQQNKWQAAWRDRILASYLDMSYKVARAGRVDDRVAGSVDAVPVRGGSEARRDGAAARARHGDVPAAGRRSGRAAAVARARRIAGSTRRSCCVPMAASPAPTRRCSSCRSANTSRSRTSSRSPGRSSKRSTTSPPANASICCASTAARCGSGQSCRLPRPQRLRRTVTATAPRHERRDRRERSLAVAVTTGICYEAVFPHLAREAVLAGQPAAHHHHQ